MRFKGACVANLCDGPLTFDQICCFVVEVNPKIVELGCGSLENITCHITPGVEVVTQIVIFDIIVGPQTTIELIDASHQGLVMDDSETRENLSLDGRWGGHFHPPNNTGCTGPRGLDAPNNQWFYHHDTRGLRDGPSRPRHKSHPMKYSQIGSDTW